MTSDALSHEFVEFIPGELAEGTLYVSIAYATAVHKCFCGCGSEVVTPLSPTDWKLIFDGETVSLSPSIGSWSLPCQSHYWIRQDRAVWAPRWAPRQIQAGRAAERAAKQSYFGSRLELPLELEVSKARRAGLASWIRGVWTRLLK